MPFSKSDFWSALIAGEAIAWLSWPILKNIKIFAYLDSYYGNSSFLFFVIWLILVPAGLLLWLYLTHRLSVWRWPVMFEIGKYGIIGWLNVFFSTGIFNLFILISGVSRGWFVDLFFLLSIAITVTCSFVWNKFWTFSAGQSGRTKAEYGRFWAVLAATSLINLFLVHLFVNVIGTPRGWEEKVWANAALVLPLLISIIGNFLGCKIFVFKEHENTIG